MMAEKGQRLTAVRAKEMVEAGEGLGGLATCARARWRRFVAASARHNIDDGFLGPINTSIG